MSRYKTGDKLVVRSYFFLPEDKLHNVTVREIEVKPSGEIYYMVSRHSDGLECWVNEDNVISKL